MKRLYRLPEEKKLGGVCAGLGEYFELDPVFFRVFFLVLLLFGGAGLLAYIVMWIMVPAKGEAREVSPGRRLHLSRSERKIAGVCGGLGEFLDVDPILFRVTFVVLAFFGGLGIVLYIALWLVMPEESPPVVSPPASADREQPGNV
jgi:phage shock protein PspC (stress-responsive transcriptional regulator)